MPPSQDAVPITSLDPQQLQGIKQRLEEDLQNLAGSNQQLQKAAGAFAASGNSIQSISEAKEGQPLLLPLTGSLYVAGSLASVDSFLIDIGTGYYAEMSAKQAVDYCNRKVSKLKQNIEACGQAIREKQSNVINVQQVLNQKVAAMQAAAAAGGGAAVAGPSA